MDKLQKLRAWIGPLLMLVIFAAALWALHRELHHYHLRDIRNAESNQVRDPNRHYLPAWLAVRRLVGDDHASSAVHRLALLNQARPTQKPLRDTTRFIEPELA